MVTQLRRLKEARATNIGLAVLLGILLIVVFNFTLAPAVDWNVYYRPATLALVLGRSPYEVNGFVNAPWVLIPMLPLLLLPDTLVRSILALAALVSVFFVSHKFGASLLGAVFVLLSPPVVSLMLDGNIDWLVIIGFVLPPWLGLFFLAIKPQITIVVALLWLVQAWRKNGWREVLRVFGPVTIALCLSFLLYGFWPLKNLQGIAWGGNTSLWPMSIPVGLALAVAAIRKQSINIAIGASPCFSPYLLFHSWIGALIALVSHTPEIVAVVTGLWVLVGIRGIQF